MFYEAKFICIYKITKILTNVRVEVLLEHIIMEEFVLKISFFNISVQAVMFV